MENNENNVQNQGKKQGKGISVPLVIIMLIVVLIIGIGGGYLLSKNDNLFNKNESQSNSNNNNESQSKKSSNTENRNNKDNEENKAKEQSKKMDENKPWVYDADYSNVKPVKTIGQSDDAYYNETSKDCLKMPFININSEDAKTVNETIKNIFEEAYDEFGKDGEYGGKVKIDTSYEYYENGNIISVVIKKSYGIVPGGSSLKMYTFNFNTETLKTASLNEMAIVCGFESEADVTNKVNQWVGRQNEMSKANVGKLASESLGVVDGQYFIDSNKKLNFVYVIQAAGTYYMSATVEPNNDIMDFYDF